MGLGLTEPYSEYFRHTVAHAPTEESIKSYFNQMRPDHGSSIYLCQTSVFGHSMISNQGYRHAIIHSKDIII